MSWETGMIPKKTGEGARVAEPETQAAWVFKVAEKGPRDHSVVECLLHLQRIAYSPPHSHPGAYNCL